MPIAALTVARLDAIASYMLNHNARAVAEKKCREVGVATMILGVFPALFGLSAVVHPFLTGEPVNALLMAVSVAGSLAGAVGFILLGNAMRKKHRGALKIGVVLFGVLALGGFSALILAENVKAPVWLIVALPIGFSATASLAGKALDEAPKGL